MLTAEQIRAARALVGWGQEKLATEAGLSRPTIKRMESKGPGGSSAQNVDAVQKSLEGAGVIFLSDGQLTDGGPGVRLRREGESVIVSADPDSPDCTRLG